MTAKLKTVKAELMRRRHLPVPEQGKWLASVVRGHEAYYAVPGNSKAVKAFRRQVIRHWRHALGRRSQRPGYLGTDVPHRQPLPASDQDQASVA